jgi:F420-non-reducing hydrogenase small subunit
MGKPKIAFYWCASCGGCEEAVIDLNEDILELAEAADIVFWPAALDFKYKDLKALGDNEISISFINGAIRLSEQEKVANLLRKKSDLVVALGSCAHLGGIPGLANFWDRQTMFNAVYREAPTVWNPEGILPQERVRIDGKELELPNFYDTVRTLGQVIDVDYYLPGCPPPANLMAEAITALLEKRLPPPGSIFAPSKSLCEDCPRTHSRPKHMSIKDIRRIHEIKADPDKCFLDQGIICLGPATRSGCGERCIRANMPCRGCFGPTDGVGDQGAKFLSALASIFDTNDEGVIRKIVASVVDPAGTFYRFSLPSSLLNRRRIVNCH